VIGGTVKNLFLSATLLFIPILSSAQHVGDVPALLNGQEFNEVLEDRLPPIEEEDEETQELLVNGRQEFMAVLLEFCPEKDHLAFLRCLSRNITELTVAIEEFRTEQ
jgi:hypothetical protein